MKHMYTCKNYKLNNSSISKLYKTQLKNQLWLPHHQFLQVIKFQLIVFLDLSGIYTVCALLDQQKHYRSLFRLQLQIVHCERSSINWSSLFSNSKQTNSGPVTIIFSSTKCQFGYMKKIYQSYRSEPLSLKVTGGEKGL